MTETSKEKVHHQPPAGISGKRLTSWVLVALAVIGIGLSSTLWTYNRLDVARRESTEMWRDVTEHLSERYRAAEKLVAEGVDSRQVKMEFGEKFRLAIDAFRTTSLPAEQVAAAERVERLLSDNEFQLFAASLPKMSSAADSLIADYNRSREREKMLLESWGGRVLDLFMKFDPPQPFTVAAAALGN